MLKPVTKLENIQQLYDRHEFLTAYEETKDLWIPSAVSSMSTDELVLAGRLAARLGDRRIWRWLFREALRRDPHNPSVRYFGRYIRQRGWTLLNQIRSFPSQTELEGFAPELRVSYLASHAVLLASVRDFTSAHEHIRRAYAVGSDTAWAASCQSDVLGLQDEWPAALKAAEKAWTHNPGAPYAAQSLANALLHLGKIDESSERLALAASNSQSYEVVALACWHKCALAETLEGDERIRVAQEARTLGNALPRLAPLADRDTKSSFAAMHLDIAMLLDEQDQIERWAHEVKSSFHRAVLDNMRKASRRERIRLSYPRRIQKYQECLPISMASVLSVFGERIDPGDVARQITFGGTREWDAAKWLQEKGYIVRFFIATPELAQKLIRNRIPFVLTLEWDHGAHAVAVIGIDEAAGTLMVHDPQQFRTTEYLISSLDSMKAPIGPRGMVIVPPGKEAVIDELLPQDSVDLMTAAVEHAKAVQYGQPAVARQLVTQISERYPAHVGAKYLGALEALDQGRTGAGLQILQELYAAFPESPVVRSRLMAAYRSAGDSALLRSALQRVVEEGVVPGMEAHQKWVHPPARYICEYADLLRSSAETQARAEVMLHAVLSREPATAEAWHILADHLWNKHEREAALLCYRLGSCLAPNQEHYAVAYCDALGNCGRKEEGLAWVEDRVRTFGRASAAVDTWISWIGTLENWGYPERALTACGEAIKAHSNEPALLNFAVAFFARMGEWGRAAEALDAVEDKQSSGYLEAAIEFHRMKGELSIAISHAETLVKQAPASANAKRTLMDLIATRDGAINAARMVEVWFTENPGNDYIEQIYFDALDSSNARDTKIYRLLLNRLKRNHDDGWAWRDLTFRALSDYQSGDGTRQKRLARRITRYLSECERTSSSEPGTLRAKAEWLECQGKWREATDLWLQSIERDPTHMYGHRHAVDCSSRFSPEDRLEVWRRMHMALREYQGRWSSARDLLLLGAERFGVRAVERLAWEWLELRPDDPAVIEAAADLLLTHGHGRSDSQRALELLDPAAARFPFHLGLQFSLSDAYRDVGDFSRSELVLEGMAAHHPGNSSVKVRLALVRERQGRVEEALGLLRAAAAGDPRNVEIASTISGIMIRAGRLTEARAFVLERLQALPANVQWRKRAIDFLSDCGDQEAAVAAARAGIDVYPRGAYMRVLLGETLDRASSHAAPGEVEQCFRRSLEFNARLFEAADWLSYVLGRQRRYAEAESVMQAITPRMGDPSAAQGRIAWIRRSEGKKSEALDMMVSIVKSAPWYDWGWSMVITWLEEDAAWDKARALLSDVPEEMRTKIAFRRSRLLLLAKAGAAAEAIDAEWDSLLQDFPEDTSAHLHRYDSLRDNKKFAEAKAVLDHIERIAPDNPYVLARRVDVNAHDLHKEAAASNLLRIFFMEVEESTWPADHAWEAVENNGWSAEVYEALVQRMQRGEKPTSRAMFLIAQHAAHVTSHTPSRSPVSLFDSLIPRKPTRDLKRLLRLCTQYSHFGLSHRAVLLSMLGKIGEQRVVARYWSRHREELHSNVDCWSQAGRAMIELGRKARARSLLSDWRHRKGVAMWMVTNYVLCFSQRLKSHIEEVGSTCADALSGLRHDHTAKYLAHRLVQAEALLERNESALKAWQSYRNYFDGKLQNQEYFRSQDKYLLSELPSALKALEAGDLRGYRKTVRWLRWKRLVNLKNLESPTLFGRRFSWWQIGWILLWLLIFIVSRLAQSS